LLVLPGSRRSEVSRHIDIFGEALSRLRGEGIAFEPLLATMPHLETIVREGVKRWKIEPRIVIGEVEKRAAFRVARAALAKSGTVTLELAFSRVPMVAAYRVGAAEAVILRRAIKVKSVILANLVLGKEVVPEFLQENCTADALARALREILTDTPQRREQVEAFASVDVMMSTGSAPSVRAADIVLATMREGRRQN
jgi:lipid-A-disaccharide synthase